MGKVSSTVTELEDLLRRRVHRVTGGPALRVALVLRLGEDLGSFLVSAAGEY